MSARACQSYVARPESDGLTLGGHRGVQVDESFGSSLEGAFIDWLSQPPATLPLVAALEIGSEAGFVLVGPSVFLGAFSSLP